MIEEKTGVPNRPVLAEASTNRPVLYELIDKDGHWAGSAYDPKWLAEQARTCWPDQSQDHERSGKGWHVKVEGAK